MRQFTISEGSRQIVVTEQAGRYAARLYVDNGNIPTQTTWQGKTEAGARKWADRVLAAWRSAIARAARRWPAEAGR